MDTRAFIWPPSHVHAVVLRIQGNARLQACSCLRRRLYMQVLCFPYHRLRSKQGTACCDPRVDPDLQRRLDLHSSRKYARLSPICSPQHSSAAQRRRPRDHHCSQRCDHKGSMYLPQPGKSLDAHRQFASEALATRR